MKAVVFDLDDTLLHNDLSISDYTLSVLRKLHNSGWAIIAASGRAYESMKPYVDLLDCVSLLIACNGGEVRDGLSHSLLFNEMLPVSVSWEIAEFGEEHNCYMHTYEGGNFFYNLSCRYAEKYASTSSLTGICVGNLRTFIHEPRSKILMIDENIKITSMLKEASERFHAKASVTCSKPCFLEFNPLNAKKGIALERCSRILNIPLSEIIAFGDSLNDLSMLKIVGRSVAVSNAREDIRLQCHEICGSNEEDGVASFLDHNYLSKEVNE